MPMMTFRPPSLAPWQQKKRRFPNKYVEPPPFVEVEQGTLSDKLNDTMGKNKHLLEVMPSEARTASQFVIYEMPDDTQALMVVFDVTAVSGTPSLTLKMEGHDYISSQDWTILEGAAVSSVSTTVYRISPHLTASANSIAKDLVPLAMKFTVTHGTADSCTYSVTAYSAE